MKRSLRTHAVIVPYHRHPGGRTPAALSRQVPRRSAGTSSFARRMAVFVRRCIGFAGISAARRWDIADRVDRCVVPCRPLPRAAAGPRGRHLLAAFFLAFFHGFAHGERAEIRGDGISTGVAAASALVLRSQPAATRIGGRRLLQAHHAHRLSRHADHQHAAFLLPADLHRRYRSGAPRCCAHPSPSRQHATRGRSRSLPAG